MQYDEISLTFTAGSVSLCCVCGHVVVFGLLLLLYAFRDLWKELGDSNFQIFSPNCQFHHRRLETLEHFNVLLYIILSTTVSFLEDTILLLLGLLFFILVCL